MGSSIDAAGVAAVVPAAGLGSRFDKRGRKLFVTLASAPLLVHALRTLQLVPSIRWIQVVVRPSESKRINRLIKRFGITKALPVCAGGNSRSQSVANGIAALPAAASWVLIHDGARPCVTAAVIQRTLLAAKRYGSAVCGLPASVTVKSARKSGQVEQTLDRSRLWFIQTPQVFRRDIIVRSLKRARGRLERFPDDAAIVEVAGHRVQVVLGDVFNLKVTTKDDLVLAEAILKYRAKCG